MDQTEEKGKHSKNRKKSNNTLEPPADLLRDANSPPPQSGSSNNDKNHRQRKIPIKSADELRRIMDIIQSRITIIIDSLDGDDNDASLKRNVITAVKHLKQINTLLEL